MALLRKYWSLSFVLLACLVFVLYLLWLQIRRYEQLGAYAFDLGIFQQAVWLMARGETPFVTVRGMNILGDHFTPILYLIAIPYRIWAHPFWLFLAQTFALAAGVVATLPNGFKAHSERLARSDNRHRLPFAPSTFHDAAF
jgi:uncharacterized membrane protein